MSFGGDPIGIRGNIKRLVSTNPSTCQGKKHRWKLHTNTFKASSHAEVSKVQSEGAARASQIWPFVSLWEEFVWASVNVTAHSACTWRVDVLDQKSPAAVRGWSVMANTGRPGRSVADCRCASWSWGRWCNGCRSLYTARSPSPARAGGSATPGSPLPSTPTRQAMFMCSLQETVQLKRWWQ